MMDFWLVAFQGKNRENQVLHNMNFEQFSILDHIFIH